MYVDNVPFEFWLKNDHSNSRWKGKAGSCWISDECIEWLIEMMADSTRDTYLEIGTFDGIAISILAERYPLKTFIAVDAFKPGTNTAGGHFGYFVENNKHLNNVHLLRGESREVLGWLERREARPDLIFVDGDHSRDGVFSDLCGSWDLINEAGLVVCHDYGGMESVKKAVDEFTYLNGVPLHEAADIVYLIKGENR